MGEQVRLTQKGMHNACQNVDCTAILVAVNKCSMRVCFHPNMAVVATENPCKNAT